LQLGGGDGDVTAQLPDGDVLGVLAQKGLHPAAVGRAGDGNGLGGDLPQDIRVRKVGVGRNLLLLG
jgi:hypothetical protein